MRISKTMRLTFHRYRCHLWAVYNSGKMIFKTGGKSPPGVKTVEKEGKKEEKKETIKKKWEKCEERCPGDPWAYCVVLWCACAMSLISSGYSLYKQQGLQGRLSLLEEQHLALRSAVLEPQQPLVERLRREVLARPPMYWRPRRSIRDYGDCVCPPGKSTLIHPKF